MPCQRTKYSNVLCFSYVYAIAKIFTLTGEQLSKMGMKNGPKPSKSMYEGLGFTVPYYVEVYGHIYYDSALISRQLSSR